MVIPALGGAERKIATVHPVHSWDRPFPNLAWTPDGRWLAFGGALSPDGPRGIWLLAADGKENQERRQVTEGPRDADMGDFSPVPSPDGTHIAFIRERTFSRSAVFVVPLTAGGVPAGSAAQLTPESWNVNGVAWTADGRDLLFSWGGHFGLSRLSRIPATSTPGGFGHPTPLPFGDQATALAISKSGRVVYSAQFRDTAFYEAPLSGSSHQPLAGSGFSSTFDEGTPHYSPDGARIAFASTRSGVEEIWIANRDGSKPEQMTSFEGPQCSNPQWSPNGRTILFNSRREGSSDLYTLVPETGEVRRLTTEPSDENEARWSRDGRWIYFGSNRTGRDEVWRIQADGSDPKQITRQGGTTATESPDRRYLYYAKDFSSPRFDLACTSRGRQRGTYRRWIELLAQFRGRRPRPLFPGCRRCATQNIDRFFRVRDGLTDDDRRPAEAVVVRHGVVARWQAAVLAGEQRGEQSHARRQFPMRATLLVHEARRCEWFRA